MNKSSATGGFVSGMGNSLADGKNIGEALNSGALTGVKGGLSGGVAGGLMQGISNSAKGANFWTWEKYWVKEGNISYARNGKKFTSTEVNKAKVFTDKYTSSNEVLKMEDKLGERIVEEFKISVSDLEKDDVFVTSLFDKRKYLIDPNTGGFIVPQFDGSGIGIDAFANYKRGLVTLSPKIINASSSQFAAVTGHELVHIYTFRTYLGGAPNLTESQIEALGYQYGVDVYILDVKPNLQQSTIDTYNRYFPGGLENIYRNVPSIYKNSLRCRFRVP